MEATRLNSRNNNLNTEGNVEEKHSDTTKKINSTGTKTLSGSDSKPADSKKTVENRVAKEEKKSKIPSFSRLLGKRTKEEETKEEETKVFNPLFTIKTGSDGTLIIAKKLEDAQPQIAEKDIPSFEIMMQSIDDFKKTKGNDLHMSVRGHDELLKNLTRYVLGNWWTFQGILTKKYEPTAAISQKEASDMQNAFTIFFTYTKTRTGSFNYDPKRQYDNGTEFSEKNQLKEYFSIDTKMKGFALKHLKSCFNFFMKEVDTNTDLAQIKLIFQKFNKKLKEEFPNESSNTEKEILRNIFLRYIANAYHGAAQEIEEKESKESGISADRLPQTNTSQIRKRINEFEMSLVSQIVGSGESHEIFDSFTKWLNSDSNNNNA